MVDEDNIFGLLRYMGDLLGHLVPDDTWYLGIAVSLGIRWNALTDLEIWQFKMPENMLLKTEKNGFQLQSGN